MGAERHHSNPVMQLVDASKFWFGPGGKTPALRHIDLEVFPGESLAIMGPSGSGKSTLLHVLGLLTFIDEGELLFQGGSVREAKLKDKNLRRNFGFVFQDAKLIPELNVLENVCVPLVHRGVWPAEQKKKAAEMLERLGLGDRMLHYPNQLSGGESMRTAIARAMILDPLILLADEPTGSLDSHTGKTISGVLFQTVAATRALVLVTHNQPLACCATRILYMKDGCLAPRPPEEET